MWRILCGGLFKTIGLSRGLLYLLLVRDAGFWKRFKYLTCPMCRRRSYWPNAPTSASWFQVSLSTWFCFLCVITQPVIVFCVLCGAPVLVCLCCKLVWLQILYVQHPGHAGGGGASHLSPAPAWVHQWSGYSVCHDPTLWSPRRPPGGPPVGSRRTPWCGWTWGSLSSSPPWSSVDFSGLYQEVRCCSGGREIKDVHK